MSEDRQPHSRSVIGDGADDNGAVAPDSAVSLPGDAAMHAAEQGLNKGSHDYPAAAAVRESTTSQDDAASSAGIPLVAWSQLGRGELGSGEAKGPRSTIVWRRLWRSIQTKGRESWIKNKGLALVFIAQLFATLMNVTTRLLEVEGNGGKGMHPFQILFARMSITVTLASAYMWWNRTEHFPFGMREVRLLLVARGLGGFFGVFGVYYSLLYLPLADATVITFLAPSLACWACSFLINEPFTRMEQIAAYVSLFGVVLIARPTSLFSSDSTPPASGSSDMVPDMSNGTETHVALSYEDVTPAQRAMAVGIAMIGVLGAASAYTTIRWIGKRAHPLISVNYFSAWCTIVSIIMMLILPDVGFVLPKSLKEWFYLIFLGFCGFTMQFLLAAGLQYEKSSRATNMLYSQMLFALGFDKLVFGVTPSALSITGSSLILGSVIYVALQKDSTKAKAGEETVETVTRDEERGLVDGMEEEGGEVEFPDTAEVRSA